MSLLLALTGGGGGTTPTSGVSVASSLAVGALTAVMAVSGLSVSTTASTGNLAGTSQFSGTSVATTVATGQGTLTGNLTGVSVGTSVAAGAVTGAAGLAGTSVATSAALGQITGSVPFSGISVSTTLSLGDLQPTASLTLIEGVSLTTTYAVGALQATAEPAPFGGHFAGKAKRKKKEPPVAVPELVQIVDVYDLATELDRRKAASAPRVEPISEDVQQPIRVAGPPELAPVTFHSAPAKVVERRGKADEELLLLFLL